MSEKFFEKNFFPPELRKKLTGNSLDNSDAPWNRVNYDGELPGASCCQRSGGKRCYEHNPINYLEYWTNESRSKEEMIDRALQIAIKFGGIDGAHHKDWVIDQMVRALTNCPIIEKHSSNHNKTYTYEVQGESEEYKQLVEWACDGEDGSETYSWEEGIAP